MKLASFKISKERVLLNWQLKATVSVEIVGTFYCLLDRPLNVVYNLEDVVMCWSIVRGVVFIIQASILVH